MSESKTLIITGMHRSATSLAANWIRGCGLHLGDTLIGPTPSNIKGHFEDKWVVEFHEKLLKKCNATMYADESQVLGFSAEDIRVAEAWVKSVSSNHAQWGFKQPRASLFLDLWGEVIPEAHYIFMVRPPQSVVGSLDHREWQKRLRIRNEAGDPEPLRAFEENRSDINNKYLSMWMRHNRDCVSFSSNLGAGKWRFVEAGALMSDKTVSDRLIRWLADAGFELDAKPVDDYFDPHMTSDRPHRISDHQRLEEAVELFNKILRL